MRNKKNKLNSIKNLIINFFRNTRFEIFNLSAPRWITVIWAILWIISLFMTWIEKPNTTTSFNSFSGLSGNVWYIIIILLAIIIILTFGSNYKEKMKLYSDIDLKNYTIILFTWTLIFLSNFIILSFSAGLEKLSTWFTFWNWLPLSVVSSILIILWGYLTRRDFQKNSSEIILEKLEQERNKAKEKNNLTFPF